LVLQIGLPWGGQLGSAGIEKVLRPRDAIALLLLVVVVFIVIAPSVDLKPTVLRGVHLSDIARLMVAAATLATLVSILPTILTSRSWHPRYTISSTNDLVVLVCARRC
jgi:hypothetical protein